jgi:hypothetical protein
MKAAFGLRFAPDFFADFFAGFLAAIRLDSPPPLCGDVVRLVVESMASGSTKPRLGGYQVSEEKTPVEHVLPSENPGRPL